MKKKAKTKSRVIDLGGKYNRKIIQSDVNPSQYHDIETGYAKYNQDFKNPKIGPPIQAASNEVIKRQFKNESTASKMKFQENKARGTSSSSVRRIIK